MNEVNGPFVLGMDRSAALVRERRALYVALGQLELGKVKSGVADAASARLSPVRDGLDAVADYARPIAIETAVRLLGIAGPSPECLAQTARDIFAHTFLNLFGDEEVARRARAAGARLRQWSLDDIAARAARAPAFGEGLVGALLEAGTLDHDGVARTICGMLVGSIDTTTTSVAKILVTLGRDPSLRERVAGDVHDPDKLAGWCREALRRWPHNPILLRSAAGPTSLGGTRVAGRDKVIVWTQAAMLDPSAFPDPFRMDPRRPAGPYLHFGGGLHPCAGRSVNAFQIPLLVGALFRRGIRCVGPLEWDGPFPARLPVRLDG